jgi:hypothetical protein
MNRRLDHEQAVKTVLSELVDCIHLNTRTSNVQTLTGALAMQVVKCELTHQLSCNNVVQGFRDYWTDWSSTRCSQIDFVGVMAEFIRCAWSWARMHKEATKCHLD